MRRIVLPLLAPMVLLAACSAGDSAEPTVSSSPVAEETVMADPAESASSEPASAEPSAPAETEETGVDLQDGVRTNDFGRMPNDFEGMAQISKETNPAEHSVRILYEAPDQQRKAQFMANFPWIDGELSPLHDTGNPSYREEIDSAVSIYEESGAEVDERSVSAGGLEWDCVEAVGPDHFDSTLCVSLRYGRVIDVQYITVHDDDADAWRQSVDELLGSVGDAVVGLA